MWACLAIGVCCGLLPASAACLISIQDVPDNPPATLCHIVQIKIAFTAALFHLFLNMAVCCEVLVEGSSPSLTNRCPQVLKRGVTSSDTGSQMFMGQWGRSAAREIRTLLCCSTHHP